MWCQLVGLIQVVGMEGRKCGSQCNFRERCSLTDKILTGEHSHEKSGRKERKYLIKKWILFHGKHTIGRARIHQDPIVEWRTGIR